MDDTTIDPMMGTGDDISDVGDEEELTDGELAPLDTDVEAEPEDGEAGGEGMVADEITDEDGGNGFGTDEPEEVM